VLGALLVVASNLFICWCFVENSYLAPVVKIQTERGHQVVSKGPYAIVRHPMYAGALFYIIGTALLFGSYCGLVLGLVMNALLVIRTALEDRTLQEELPGYAEYAGKVRYRLFPGMW
jgi:protein-S-isoprenylcysteine O-methyltransferase Ste14